LVYDKSKSECDFGDFSGHDWKQQRTGGECNGCPREQTWAPSDKHGIFCSKIVFKRMSFVVALVDGSAPGFEAFALHLDLRNEDTQLEDENKNSLNSSTQRRLPKLNNTIGQV